MKQKRGHTDRPHKQNQLILEKGAEAIQKRKLLTNGTTGYSQAKKRGGGLDTDPTQNLTQNRSCLNVECKTIKFLEANIGENLGDLRFVMPFQIQITKA